jgi:hypothetical protein
MKLITSKFGSKCHKTGQQIKKGELMYYDYANRKVYCKKYIDELNEAYNTKQFIQAQEDAYFDKFISLNYYSHENQ